MKDLRAKRARNEGSTGPAGVQRRLEMTCEGFVEGCGEVEKHLKLVPALLRFFRRLLRLRFTHSLSHTLPHTLSHTHSHILTHTLTH